MALSIATAAMTTAMHPPLPEPEQELMNTENSVNDNRDGEEEKKDAHQHFHFNGPTPRHKNHGFFQEEHPDGDAEPQRSQSNSQMKIEPSAKEEKIDVDGQQSNNDIVSQSKHVEEPVEREKSSRNQSSRKQQQQQQSPPKRIRRRRNTAVIEGDASTAFSPYRPVVPLSSPSEKVAVTNNNPIDTQNDDKQKKKGKRKERRDKRDHQRDGQQNRGHHRKSNESRHTKDELEGINSARPDSTSLVLHTSPTTNVAQHLATKYNADPIQSILQKDDPILQNYLPQLTFLNDNYYSKVKTYRMGKRNLPLDQLEVILRRRAVKKRPADAPKNQAAKTSLVGDTTSTKSNNRPPPPSSLLSRRPPPFSPPRRKLFPTTQQHSPTPSHRKNGQYEDDSTISSTTVASQLTSWIPTAFPIKQQPQQFSPPSSFPPQQAMPISTIPKEEIIGDTSLGLKLTILHGKVIIQHITPLADGRASPAQLCGSLLNPGDIIIAVNGKSLINGTIHNPVGMDRIISVLKPLSQPADEDTKEYSREVRLRIVVGEGRALLRHQEEREKQKLQDRERRKKLGLDHRDRGMDPAADLFGIGAFMGVDQHSGMPMFGHLEHPSYQEEDEKKEEKKDAAEDGSVSKGQSSKTVQEEESEATRGTLIQERIQQSSFTDRARVPTVQAQIAHHIQLDRQYIRNRNTSGFFSMNENATPILRPPSTPQPHHSSSDLQTAELTNPMDIRKKRLERGTQTMIHAKSLVALVEAQDLGLDLREYEDEDPMEVASRACGTASVRTGASRRWHRGGGGGGESAIVEESDAASRASSMDNPNINFDISTIRSGESGIEAYCDHRQLVELAANNDSWKRNVLKRLEAYAKDTEKGSSSNPAEEKVVPPPSTATSIDTLLFGGDVANILNKKKQSLALPPGEMTCMLYDLVELLESSDDGLLLPDQIFMNNNKDDTLMSALVPFGSPEKAVTFSKNHGLEERKDNANVETATNFLINDALGIWLKSFRPLPWKQRRALWPYHSSGLDGDSTIMSSRMDDNESLSMMSGTITTTQQSSMYLKDKKRNLREVIEDLELDHETRRETCRLVTFYLTQKFSNAPQTASIRDSNVQHTTLPTTFKLSQKDEDEAAALIDAYGSYLDIYKCLVFAGKLHSKRMVDKLVGVAKYDSQHKEAMKALQKAKVLLFYEPNMLSALLELLPSISTKQYSSNFDFITLLVSAYPDLQPWCVQEAYAEQHSGGSGGFYMEYLSTLLHHEDGNDAAKRDEALVKEWCSMLCSPPDDVATDPAIAETYCQSFFRIASRDDTSSLLYHRDLAFLMDISVQMSEFGLTLSLANEIISNQRYCRDKQALLNVLQHLCIISDKAIEGNEGELNAVLLGQVISFFNVIPPCMEEHNCEFNNVTELSKLLEKCHTETQNNQQYSPSNIDACITTISENAPPTHSLQVLSQWEHHTTTTEFGSSSSSLMSALHTCLIRGAREGVRNELSGSLLRIQRAREEGRRPIVVDNGMMMMSCWNADAQYESVGGDDGEEGEAGGFIWSSVIDGTLAIAK